MDKLFESIYPTVVYKVTKKDCTSRIGIIVQKDNEWKFIPNEEVPEHRYDNAFVVNKNLYVRKKRNGSVCKDTFTKLDGRIVLENEWDRLKEMDSPDYVSLVSNLKSIRSILRGQNYAYTT